VAVPAAATAELYSVASEPSAFLPVMSAESEASSKEVQKGAPNDSLYGQAPLNVWRVSITCQRGRQAQRERPKGENGGSQRIGGGPDRGFHRGLDTIGVNIK